jgi:hypothetical protein
MRHNEPTQPRPIVADGKYNLQALGKCSLGRHSHIHIVVEPSVYAQQMSMNKPSALCVRPSVISSRSR